jgi:hypothetical protein
MVTDLPNLAIAKDNGAGTWLDLSGTANGGLCDASRYSGDILSDPFTSFSKFALANKVGGVNPLPVEFLTFNAAPNGTTVDITWSTAVEFNSDYFIVQHSHEGSNFEEVIRVNAAGNSSTLKKYAAVDPDPYPGVSYYRLRQVDKDGKFAYSDVVAVYFNGSNTINVYPSLSSGNFNVSVSGEKGKKFLLVVRDILGKEYYSTELIIDNDTFIQNLDLSEKLSPGLYMVTASSDDHLLQKRIVIK